MDFYHHKRTLKKDRLEESVILRICTTDYNRIISTDADGKHSYADKKVFSHELKINEFRYPNLVNSKKRIINDTINEIAKRYMPDLTNMDNGG